MMGDFSLRRTLSGMRSRPKKEGTVMKLVIGIFIGMVFSGLILGLISGGVLRAEDDGESDLTTLLPDIGRIYRESLAAPFQQVEAEIEDEDIANFYHQLMQKTGLTQVDED